MHGWRRRRAACSRWTRTATPGAISRTCGSGSGPPGGVGARRRTSSTPGRWTASARSSGRSGERLERTAYDGPVVLEVETPEGIGLREPPRIVEPGLELETPSDSLRQKVHHALVHVRAVSRRVEPVPNLRERGEDPYLEARLLPDFTDRRLLQGLPGFHGPLGEPPDPLVRPSDQEDPSPGIDHRAPARQRGLHRPPGPRFPAPLRSWDSRQSRGSREVLLQDLREPPVVQGRGGVVRRDCGNSLEPRAPPPRGGDVRRRARK